MWTRTCLRASMLLTPADKGLAGGEMEQLSSLIRRALDDMRVYQGRLLRDPAVAQVSLAGVPHALVPTRVLAQAFPEALQDLVGADCAPLVMYRLGHLIGQTQAAAFFAERAIDPTDLPYRVLTGPFHIAWAGYADVDLLVWEPHADGRFAVLWESDNSCCAREVARKHRRTRACHLPAGYSAGWCTEATGLPLETCELACRVEGVGHCRFLVGHAAHMHERVLDPRFHQPTDRYTITPARTVAPMPA